MKTIEQLFGELELVTKEITFFTEMEASNGIKVKELRNMMADRHRLQGQIQRRIDKMKPKNVTATV